MQTDTDGLFSFEETHGVDRIDLGKAKKVATFVVSWNYALSDKHALADPGRDNRSANLGVIMQLPD